jgi:hypothetical protein
MLWIPLLLVSVVVLYNLYENVHGARELADAHQRMVDRIGTDDFRKLVPPEVLDEQNYFAIPVIQSWAEPPEDGGTFPQYALPDLMPKDFIWPEIVGEGSESRLDLKGWAAKRAAAGQPLAAGESPVAVLDRELGDGHGVLAQLASGLSRPLCCWKPSQREIAARLGDNPWLMECPMVRNVNLFLRQLSLLTRVASHNGNALSARDTCLIALRFCEGSSSHGSWLTALVGTATYETVFPAIADSLCCPVWDDASLTRLQAELAKINDLAVFEHGLGYEILEHYAGGLWLRQRRGTIPAEAHRPLEKYGPIGWFDANIAYYVDTMLDRLGPRSDTAWLGSRSRERELDDRIAADVKGWNPRRVLGASAVPSLGPFVEETAKCLFQRRALIIGCALERYRLSHGAYPSSLVEVAQELSAFPVNDPARPTQPLGYRLEPNGYLLWSAGPDAKDDGGDPENDWLWRMKRD